MLKRFILLLLLLSTVSSTLFEWSKNQDLTQPSSDRPIFLDSAGKPIKSPTPVFVGLSTMRINSIDIVSGTFYIDTYCYLAFRDDRYNGTTGQLTTLTWDPKIELINMAADVEEDPMAQIQWYVAEKPVWVIYSKSTGYPEASGGIWVVGQTRLRVDASSLLDLAHFPFDNQVSGLFFESTKWLSNELVWVPTSSCVNGLIPSETPGKHDPVDGWDVTSTTARSEDFVYTQLGETYNRLSAEFSIKRQSAYYVNRYVFGCGLLVTMALLVLCLRGDEPDRLGFVQSSFLGLVSWQFILVSSVPPLGYSTSLDLFMMFSIFTVFIAFFWNGARMGYFKTLEHASGRTEALEELRGGSKSENNDDSIETLKKPTNSIAISNPMNSSLSDPPPPPPPPTSSSSATVTITKPLASKPASSNAIVPDDEEEKVNDLAYIFFSHWPCWRGTRKRNFTMAVGWAGQWSKYNPHRKLDWYFGFSAFIVYVAISAALLR
jgi:hypothetical protein